jgi:hypothetical protein
VDATQRRPALTRAPLVAQVFLVERVDETTGDAMLHLKACVLPVSCPLVLTSASRFRLCASCGRCPRTSPLCDATFASPSSASITSVRALFVKFHIPVLTSLGRSLFKRAEGQLSARVSRRRRGRACEASAGVRASHRSSPAHTSSRSGYRNTTRTTGRWTIRLYLSSWNTTRAASCRRRRGSRRCVAFPTDVYDRTLTNSSDGAARL